MKLSRWYQSMTMGNLVKTKFGVVFQFIESLVRYRTVDARWKTVWLYAGE